jgi:hypothetical protein
MPSDRVGHVPFLGGQIDIDSCLENLISGLVLGLDLLEGLRGIPKHSQLTIPVRSDYLVLPTGFQGLGRLLRGRQKSTGSQLTLSIRAVTSSIAKIVETRGFTG